MMEEIKYRLAEKLEEDIKNEFGEGVGLSIAGSIISSAGFGFCYLGMYALSKDFHLSGGDAYPRIVGDFIISAIGLTILGGGVRILIGGYRSFRDCRKLSIDEENKELRKKFREQQIQDNTELEQGRKQVIYFGGNLEEYERWKGYGCEIMDPSILSISPATKKWALPILRNGLEALVNCSDGYRGLPVRKKQDKS